MLNINTVSRDLIVTILYSIIIKGGALLISLALLPLYMDYFNNKHMLGLWFSVYSILSWILNFDLGIGNGLRNSMTKAIVEKNDEKISQLICSSYLITFVFVIVFYSLYSLIRSDISWENILHISQDNEYENVMNAIDIVVFSVLLQILLRNITYIYYAEQLPNINNITSLISLLIVLVFLISNYLWNKDEGDIVTIAYVNLIAVNAPLLLVTLFYFSYRKKRRIFMRNNPFTREVMNDIFGLGLGFFYVQITYMVIASSNEFFINYFCDSESVVIYSAYNRLFSIIVMVMGVLTIPIWSAVTKAIAEKKVLWVKKALDIFLYLGIMSVFFNTILAIFAQQVFDLWLQNNSFEINTIDVWIFSLYGSAISIVAVLTTFANGLGKIKIQIIMYSIIALVKIITASIIVNKMGWIGIIFVSAIGLYAFIIIQYLAIYRELSDGKNC